MSHKLHAILRTLAWLESQERYDPDGGFSYWPFHLDGSTVLGSHMATLFPLTCTHGARLVVKHLGGVVLGYAEGKNPEAMAGRGRVNDGDTNIGHDFAVVGEYLVDYWLLATYGMPQFGILHLEHDAMEIRRLYGPIEHWEELP